MQFFSILVFVSAVAAIAVRQDVPTPPECAFSCLTNTNTQGCSITDNSCLCRNSQFIADQSACIAQACTDPSDLQQADAFAQANCLAVGVTLTAASTATATSSGSSASTTSLSNSSSNAASPSSSTVTTPAVLLISLAAFAFAL